MERSKERNVLLEYYDKGHTFHYNYNAHNAPSEQFRELGWCSEKEADVFCHLMFPLKAFHKHGEILVTFDRMKKAWKIFCEIIKDEKIIIK